MASRGRMSGRRRRKLLKRAGIACYAVAGIIAAVAIVGFVNGQSDGSTGAAGAAEHDDNERSRSGVTTTTTDPLPPAIATSEAAQRGFQRLDPPPRASDEAVLDSRNTPPWFTGPTEVVVAAIGDTPIVGIGIEDVEARRYGSDVGVVVFAPRGRLRFGNTDGVRFLDGIEDQWIPMIGPIEAVNQVLATVSYLPSTSRQQHLIWLFGGDFGHGDRDRELFTERWITVELDGV